MTQVEFKHLRTAIAAAECGSFSSAALQLNVEASAVSRTVRELELNLGALLFERLPRGVRLTSVGERYVETARDVLAMLDGARVEARAENGGHSGRLAIGYIWSLARGSAASLIGSYRAANPKVSLHLFEDGPEPMLHRLGRGSLDVVLTATPSREMLYTDGLELPMTMPLWTEKLYVLVPSDSDHASVDWLDVAKHDLLYRRSDAAAPFAGYVKAIGGPELTFVPQDCSHEGLAGLVAAGLGWFIAPESMARSDLSGVRPVPISSRGATMQVVALWRKQTRNPALDRFLELARDFYSADTFIPLELYVAPSRSHDPLP